MALMVVFLVFAFALIGDLLSLFRITFVAMAKLIVIGVVIYYGLMFLAPIALVVFGIMAALWVIGKVLERL